MIAWKHLLLITANFLYITRGILATCPSKCTCNNNSINCIEQGLQDVPVFETISNDPLVIDLSGNKLITIDIYDFSFERNAELKEVYLNNSELTDIEDRSFDELINLQELYLHNNHLKSIPKNIIKYNKNIIVLDLSNNIFETLPVLSSSSLEVLALANSGISKIHEGSLKEVPNLRVLLLQENKITQISLSVFDGLQSVFFVKLAYNLWNCNCETVRLFDFLVAKGFTEISDYEPVQCVTQDKNFLGIYYKNGTDSIFKEMCSEEKKVLQENSNIFKDYKEVKQISDRANDNNDTTVVGKLEILNKRKETSKTPPENIQHLQRETFNKTVHPKSDSFDDGRFDDSLRTTLLISIPISFLIGVLFGCYITFTYGKSYVKLNATESSKKLLSASTEGVTKEEYA